MSPWMCMDFGTWRCEHYNMLTRPRCANMGAYYLTVARAPVAVRVRLWLCGWQSVDGPLEDEAGPPRGAERAGAEGADGPEGVGPVGQRRLGPVPGCPL